jgi:hypothetical protein
MERPGAAHAAATPLRNRSLHGLGVMSVALQTTRKVPTQTTPTARTRNSRRTQATFATQGPDPCRRRQSLQNRHRCEVQAASASAAGGPNGLRRAGPILRVGEHVGMRRTDLWGQRLGTAVLAAIAAVTVLGAALVPRYGRTDDVWEWDDIARARVAPVLGLISVLGGITVESATRPHRSPLGGTTDPDCVRRRVRSRRAAFRCVA